MAIALHHSRATGAAKLVLVGIANHDGDGGSWPSINTLAKYAAVTPRNVQKSIQQLEKLGEIRRHVGAGGTHMTADHMRPNLYQFILQCPASCDHSSRHRVRGESAAVNLFDPPSPATGGVGSDGGPPVASDTGGVSSATPEPSLNRNQIHPRPKATTDARADKTERCSGSASGTHRPHPDTGWCLNACGHRIDHLTGAIAS